MDSDLRDRPACRPSEARSTANPGGGGRAAAALISVCLGLFVIQLDVTIVNVALPAIQHEIGGSLAGLQWVVDAGT
jgi:DHA2 family methylenomycin A resistance protein-like MFS transporter